MYTFELSRPVPDSKSWHKVEVDLSMPLIRHHVFSVLENGRWVQQGLVLADGERVVFGPETKIRHIAYLIWTKSMQDVHFMHEGTKSLFMLNDKVSRTKPILDPVEVYSRSELAGQEPEISFDNLVIDFGAGEPVTETNLPIEQTSIAQRLIARIKARSYLREKLT